MNPRKIIYVTGTRADFGLMRLILQKLDADGAIDLSLCVTGMHLSSLYGNTVEEIKAEHFRICGQISTEVNQSTQLSMAQSIGQGIIGMAELFHHETPDMVLLLGDRGEMLAAAIAAIHLNIPIVHIHGGERSGTVDEMVRHAISKLAHYHLVATKASKQRLIKMGEHEAHIYEVGAPGLDELKNQAILPKNVFYERYGFSPHKKTGLLVYHPVVQEYEMLKIQLEQAIEAALSHDLQLICLEPNSDAGGHLIRELLYNYQDHPQIRIIKHLIRSEYINCLAHVDVMLGNSSSGVIEAASFNLTVINIGTRQNLREQSNNIINSECSLGSITKALQEALERKNPSYSNVYGAGTSSQLCYQLIRTLDLNPTILSKCNAY